ncbi:hypothetical protein Tco_0811738 [Tanacetum coccineum]
MSQNLKLHHFPLKHLQLQHPKLKHTKLQRTKKDIELPQTSVPLDHGADEAVHKERVDSGSPRCQETMGGTPGQTRSERVLAQPNEPPLSEGHTSRSGEGRMKHTFELTSNVPSTPHDSPLPGGYTLGSDEGRMKLDELITLCTKLLKQVLDLENKKDAQVVEILNLKRREDASKQGRRSDKLKPMFNDKDFEELDNYIENVKEETVDAAATGVSTVSAPVSTAGVTISTAEPRTPSTTTTVFDDEDVTIAMAQTLIKIKGQKAKEKGVAITDVENSSRIDVAEEQESPKSDEEAAIDYEHEKEELRMWLTIVLDEEETVDPKILSAKYPIVDWESHNLRNVDMEDLHVYKIIRADGNTSYHKSLSSMHRIFDKQDLVNLHRLVMKRFEDTTLEDYEHEKEELRMWLTVVSDEEETIIRVDGNTSYHKSLSSMLRIFDRQDLVDLHRLVMKRFEDTTPEGYNLLLWGDLKVIFEPNAEDEIWSNQQDWTLISYKLYESCRVHTLLMDEDTSSSNEVNTANGVSTAGHNSQGQASSSSYTDDIMFSFFVSQSSSPQLDDEDLEQIDHDDLKN